MTHVENSQKNLPSQKIHNYSKSFEKGKEKEMKDLSKEERTKQHISKLEKRISEMCEEGRKNKWLRIRLTFYILSGFVYYIALDAEIISETAGLLVWLIFAPLIAVGVMSLSYVILAYALNGVIKDAFDIGNMVGRKDAIELSKLNED